MEPGLYLVGTPIGNLGDITLRALEVLRDCDVILAEDTRHTLKLLNHYEIRKHLISCHRFNEASRTVAVVRRIAEGGSVALVSNAGMPGISDPGTRVLRACREAGLPVTAIPGPTAAATAAALSGWADEGFHFEGFLPPKSGGRARRLEELRTSPLPVLLYESPHRMARLLSELHAAFGDRPVQVFRELTKKFEERLEGPAEDLLREWESRHLKGECVVVVAPLDKRRRREDAAASASNTDD